MIQEEKSRFYKMLILFSRRSMHDRTRLLSQYPEELVDEAIQKGYIREVQKDAFGVPTYAITDSGKEVWE